MINDFGDCLDSGLSGENLFLKKYGHKFPPLTHIDYNTNPELQRKGVDFISCGGRLLLDIKVRSYQYLNTGDILFETLSIAEKNKPGWLYYSNSWVVYLWYNEDRTDFVKGYILNLPIIRVWLKGKNYPTTPAPNRDYHTINMVVPIKDIPAHLIKDISQDIKICQMI